MKHIYWIGIRQSDLLSIDNLYNGSVTFFGDGRNGNISLTQTGIPRINHNIDSAIFLEFYEMAMKRILEADNNAKFMFYNPIFAYYLDNQLHKNIICLNNLDVLKILNDKILCKLWLKNDVQMLENVQMFGKEISLNHLNNIFDNKSEYIIQQPISSGGIGTFVLNEQNEKNIISKLLPFKQYTISAYYHNAIPINVHCVIYENDYCIYPSSIQIIKTENDNLLYKGCDFITAESLEYKVKEQINKQVLNICERLRKLNYRGICGLDFLIINNKVYFCEINPRFQASTTTLNIALIREKQLSVNEATINAFQNNYQYNKKERIFHVPYSLYAYEELNELNSFHQNIFQTYFNLHPEYQMLKDGYDFDVVSETGAYLFRTIYSHPLTSIYNNILRTNELFTGYSLTKPVDIIQLKIMLLNFGVKISSSALEFIEKEGKIRTANFSAIDIILWDDLVINCPYMISFTVFSPFEIRLQNKKLILFYFENEIAEIEIFYESKLNDKKTLNGTCYSSAAFLATDRLRINYNPVCFYKKIQKSCQFCNLPTQNQSYDFKTVCEIIDGFIEGEEFRHILLGGGSSEPQNDFSNIIKLANYLKTTTDKPLYLMSLPPADLEIIPQLYNAGISEIAFNIEIFDPNLAMKYMPGKGMISREHYFEALRKSTMLWGKKGSVRSMVIVGLEPEDTLLAGIEKLCQIGVQPMLSIFRPMEHTILSSLLPLTCRDIYELYLKIYNICLKYGQLLGPTCIYCQNNTLAIPKKYKKKELFIC